MKVMGKSQRPRLSDFSYIQPFSALFLPFAFCLLPFAASSCGYHLASFGKLPQNIQQVTFADIENDTLEVGVEKKLQWALEREFRYRGGVTITEDGEGIFNVVLRRLDQRPVASSSADQVLEYQATMVIDVSLTHR